MSTRPIPPTSRSKWAALLTICLLSLHTTIATAQPAGGNVNLAAALDDAAVIGILSPQRLLADKSLELMPTELLTVAGTEEFGIDPLTISRVYMFMKTPENLERPPHAGFIIQLTKPADEAAIVKATGAEQLPGNEHKVYMSPKLPLAFTVANAKTIVAVTDPVMFESILTEPTGRPSGVLVDLITEKSAGNDIVYAVSVDKLRPLINTLLQEAPALPPPYENLKTLPDHISTFEAHAKLTGGGSLGVTINAVDEAAAEKLEQTANNWINIGKQLVLEQMEKELTQSNGEDPYALAMQEYLQRVSGEVSEMLRPHREGTELVFFDHDEGPSFDGMAVNGVMVALLLPAVQAAREAARRIQSANNMKQITIGMHNYHDTYRKLPAQAIYDDNGKPLLSWRVQLLPFIGEAQLYERFKLDQPWDSPHNIELSKIVVEVYQNPNLPGNKTTYLAPVGQGMVMNGNQTTRFADIRDGMSNTIMVVEANPDQAVIWTKPADLTVDVDNPLQGLGKLRNGIFQAAFADGRIMAISNEVEQEVLKYMFLINDGQAFELPR